MDRYRVLIVDDHPVVLAGISSLIKLVVRSAELFVYSDFESASRAKHLRDFDLTILDINLPESSAFDFLNKHREGRGFGHLVFLSADLTAKNVKAAISLGARGILSKFEPPESLVEAFKRIFLGEHVYSEVVNQKAFLSGEIMQETENIPLTDRELEVLKCLAHGKGTKDTAKQLFISPKTVDRHRCNIMNKLDMHSQIELSHFAIRKGIISL